MENFENSFGFMKVNMLIEQSSGCRMEGDREGEAFREGISVNVSEDLEDDIDIGKCFGSWELG